MRTNKEWIQNNFKPLRHPDNKEFVTARVNIINKRKVIRISIGLVICDLLQFTRNDRVHVFANKHDRDLMLFRKALTPHDGYKLNFSGSGSNFLTFDFRYETLEPFRLSQTIILDYEINDDGYLLINLNKIKWNN